MAEVAIDPQQLVTITKHRHINEKKSEALREKWNKVAGRIDLVLMIVFLIANVAVCASLLAVGNSKLNK